MNKFFPIILTILSLISGAVYAQPWGPQPVGTANVSLNNVPPVGRHNFGAVGNGVNIATDVTPAGVGDGKDGRFVATWTSGTATLSLLTQTATVVTTAGSNVIAMSAPTYDGALFNNNDVGKCLAIVGVTFNGTARGLADGLPCSPISIVQDSLDVQTVDTADQTINTSANMIWPAPTATAVGSITSDVGKWIRVDMAIVDPDIPTQPANYTTIGLSVPWVTQIQAVTSGGFGLTLLSQAPVTLTGSPANGDVFNLIFAASGATPVLPTTTITYTANNTDTDSTILQGLTALVNANPAVTAVFGPMVYVNGEAYIPFQSGVTATISATKTSAGTTFKANTTTGFVNSITTNPRRISWGTDNTNAIVAASIAATQFGAADTKPSYRVFFPGGPYGSTYLSFTMGPAYPNTVGYGTTIGQEASAEVQFIGDDNVSGLITDAAGMPALRQIIPTSAGPAPDTSYSNSPASLVRIADTSTPIVATWGASKGTINGGGALIIEGSTERLIVDALNRSNIGKYFADAGDFDIGGQTWTDMASISTASPLPGWYTNSSLTWRSYIESFASPNSSGVTVNPDIIFLLQPGNNDSCQIQSQSILQVINDINDPTQFSVDNYGHPPDIVMETLGATSQIRGTSYASGYYPDFTYLQNCLKFAGGISLTEALVRGYKAFDVWTPQMHSIWGWSERSNSLQHVTGEPAISLANNARYTVPNDWVTKWSSYFTLGSGAVSPQTFWNFSSSAGTCQTVMHIALSSELDNIFDIGCDPAGNLMMRAYKWGGYCTAPITTSPGSPNVTFGTTGQTTTTTAYSVGQNNFLFGNSGSLTFTTDPSLANGTPVVLTGANQANTDSGNIRAFTVDHISANKVYALNVSPPTKLSSGSRSITYGGCPWMADDGGVTVYIPGAGTAWSGNGQASGTTFTLNTTATGQIQPGSILAGGSLSGSPAIVSLASGTWGANGSTYVISVSQGTVAAASMTGSGTLVTTVKSVTDATHIVLNANATQTLSAVSTTMFLGEMSVPSPLGTNANANGWLTYYAPYGNPPAADTSTVTEPIVWASVDDDQVTLLYQRHSDVGKQQPWIKIFQGPVIRALSPYYPSIWFTGLSGSQTVQATYVFTEHKELFQPSLTTLESFGNGDNTWPFGNSEFTETGISGYWTRAIRAMSLAAAPNPVILPAKTVTASSASAYCGQVVPVDPTNNAVQINLPSTCLTSTPIVVKDATGQAATHNITIAAPSGTTLRGSNAGTVVISTNNGSQTIYYTAANTATY